MQSSKGLSPIKVGVIIALSAVISLCVLAVIQIPKFAHQEWQRLGSPYNVEDEFLYTNTLRHIRQNIIGYFGINNFIDPILREWQQDITNRALAKIPENDGERLLWQLDVDRDFWYSIDRNLNIPQITPKALEYFDEFPKKEKIYNQLQHILCIPVKDFTRDRPIELKMAQDLVAFINNNYVENGKIFQSHLSSDYPVLDLGAIFSEMYKCSSSDDQG